MWELMLENMTQFNYHDGVLTYGRGHQERQNSEITYGEYALWSLAPIALELSNKKKYWKIIVLEKEKLLSLVSEGLYQSQLL